MKMTLRHANDTDFEEIAAWITDSHACMRWAGPFVAFPFGHQNLSCLLHKPGVVSLAMTNNLGQLLGFAQYWPRDEQRTHLGRIIVNPKSRGQGIGKVLCEQLIGTAMAATNTPIISLRVYRDNHNAHHLYQQLGFKACEEESNAEVLAMEKLR